MKRYDIWCECDRFGKVSEERVSGASTMAVAQMCIRIYRKKYAERNPRNFYVRDLWADVPEGEPQPTVYREQ